MASVINCAFARVAILEASRMVKSGGDMHTLKERRLETYLRPVGKDDVLTMPFRDFNVNAKVIAAKFLDWNKKGKENRSERDVYANFFSSRKWNEMTSTERKNHKLSDCKACFNTEHQLLFEKNCDKKRPRLALIDISNKSNISVASTPSCKADIANQAYNSLRYVIENSSCRRQDTGGIPN